MAVVIRGPESEAAPSEYQLTGGEGFEPESVTATFNGAGAAGAFLPALSVYAQSGELLARSPASEVAAGDSAEVTFAPLLRAAQVAAAASGGYPFCQAGINGNYAILDNTLTTIGIDPGALIDSGAGVFSEDTNGAGVTGVKINEAGTYLGMFSVQLTDSLGAALANPQDFVAYAQESSASVFVGLDNLDSLYARGFAALITGDSRFEVGWKSLFTTHGATTAGQPIIIQTKQATGITLHAYTQVAVFQILPTAIF